MKLYARKKDRTVYPNLDNGLHEILDIVGNRIKLDDSGRRYDLKDFEICDSSNVVYKKNREFIKNLMYYSNFEAFYNENKKFKEYVDKVSKSKGISKEQAMDYALVKEVGLHYMEEQE